MDVQWLCHCSRGKTRSAHAQVKPVAKPVKVYLSPLYREIDCAPGDALKADGGEQGGTAGVGSFFEQFEARLAAELHCEPRRLQIATTEQAMHDTSTYGVILLCSKVLEHQELLDQILEMLRAFQKRGLPACQRRFTRVCTSSTPWGAAYRLERAHTQCLTLVPALVPARDPRAHAGKPIVLLASAAAPFDEYIRNMREDLKKAGLFQEVFQKWPTGRRLQEAAAVHAINYPSRQPKRFWSHLSRLPLEFAVASSRLMQRARGRACCTGCSGCSSCSCCNEQLRRLLPRWERERTASSWDCCESSSALSAPAKPSGPGARS